MALSAGMRRAVGMALGWLALTCAAAVSGVYFHEIKSATRTLLGLEPSRPANLAAEPARTTHSHRSVEIKAGARGHYFASAEVNGRPIDVLVEPGASLVGAITAHKVPAAVTEPGSLATSLLGMSFLAQRIDMRAGALRCRSREIEGEVAEVHVSHVPTARL